MIKFASAVFFILLFAAPLEAQDGYLWIEPQVAIERDESGKASTGEHFTTLSFAHQWKPWLGIFVQTAHGNFWGESAIGPSFFLGENFQINVGVGVEHYEPRPLRLKVNGYYDKLDTGSFVYVQFDTDKESRWVWADAAYMFNDVVGAGVLLQMPGGGIGPKLELRAGKHLGFWVAPVYEWREKTTRLLVGGRIMTDW